MLVLAYIGGPRGWEWGVGWVEVCAQGEGAGGCQAQEGWVPQSGEGGMDWRPQGEGRGDDVHDCEPWRAAYNPNQQTE